MSEAIVEVRDLWKYFGAIQAVRGISFDLTRGHVIGFIGANGSGKTTTMRMMAGLDLPSSGTIRVAGYDVVHYPHKVQEILGWMPDAFGVYDNVTVEEYLDFYARAYWLYGAQRRARVEEVMEFADLKPIADRLMNALSKGMAQRLCLGRTLLNDPEFLILDEPAAGLDPKARLEFKNVVRLLSERGKTIFISSHILSELEEMCDSLLFIDRGTIVHQGASEDLKQTTAENCVISVLVHGDPVVLENWARANPGVEFREPLKRGARLRFEQNDPAELSRQLRKMLNDGVEVVDFHREEQRLEDAFVQILKRERGA
ncbi:ABC transporter ATP-binding protein [Verrucomicrobia bacterium LW23]|nr:ABC transporter ATP-binding protein [Verrucomicrobia bacterium LW23]